MMDASGMFPRGYHPHMTHTLPDMSRNAPFLLRIAARPIVKYYFIDFGLAQHFPKGASSLVVGDVGRDDAVPELSDTVPYDAFKVDIFTLGHLFATEFQEVRA